MLPGYLNRGRNRSSAQALMKAHHTSSWRGSHCFSPKGRIGKLECTGCLILLAIPSLWRCMTMFLRRNSATLRLYSAPNSVPQEGNADQDRIGEAGSIHLLSARGFGEWLHGFRENASQGEHLELLPYPVWPRRKVETESYSICLPTGLHQRDRQDASSRAI